MSKEARKYRKKPVVIEAWQWDGTVEEAERIKEWSEGAVDLPTHHHELRVRTKEGIVRAVEGDFIIRGVAGEFYPCDVDIFAQTYEEVLEPPAVDDVIRGS